MTIRRIHLVVFYVAASGRDPLKPLGVQQYLSPRWMSTPRSRAAAHHYIAWLIGGGILFLIGAVCLVVQPIGKITDYARAIERGERPAKPKIGSARVNTLATRLIPCASFGRPCYAEPTSRANPRDEKPARCDPWCGGIARRRHPIRTASAPRNTAPRPRAANAVNRCWNFRIEGRARWKPDEIDFHAIVARALTKPDACEIAGV